MTNGEKGAIIAAAERIRKLASLENAGFGFDRKQDEFIKQKITPYMSWFELVAYDLERLANAENGYEKKFIIEEIHNHNY